MARINFATLPSLPMAARRFLIIAESGKKIIAAGAGRCARVSPLPIPRCKHLRHTGLGVLPKRKRGCKMGKYVLLKKDGTVEYKEAGNKLELETMYSWIECRCIDIAESVISAKMGCNAMLIFDDEFLLNQIKPQANKIARLFFGYTMTTDECLCGNVIVAKDVDGETAGFTDEEILKIQSLIDICKEYSRFIKFSVQEPKMMFIPGF